MSGHGQKLSRKQEVALAALLLQPTIREAAKVAAISEATLFRWLQLPDFQEAYRQAKRQAVGQAVTTLQRVSGEAVETLRKVMADEKAPASARVTAARAVLETAIKAVELEDLVARIEELERVAGQKAGGR